MNTIDDDTFAFMECRAREIAARIGLSHIPDFEFRRKHTNIACAKFLGWKIIFNINWINRHSLDQIEDVLTHELIHFVTIGDHHGKEFKKLCIENNCDYHRIKKK